MIEAYAERTFRRAGDDQPAGGQFRTPFGIYTRSDYGYTGFVRPPLIRYDGYFGLSNNYMERGAIGGRHASVVRRGEPWQAAGPGQLTPPQGHRRIGPGPGYRGPLSSA